MFSATDASYKQARAIKKGEYKLHPVHQELVDWFSKQFGIKALDFIFEIKQTSVGYKQQVVRISIETIAEAKQWESDRKNEKKTIEKFMSYLLMGSKYTEHNDALKKDIWKIDVGFPDTYAVCCPLEEVERMVAMEKAYEAHKALQGKYSQYIWTISAFTPGSEHINVFLHTDAQIEEFKNNGTAEKFFDDLLSELKKHDEFNYLGQHSITVHYDSHETFEKHYQGNWYYYYK